MMTALWIILGIIVLVVAFVVVGILTIVSRSGIAGVVAMAMVSKHMKKKKKG